MLARAIQAGIFWERCPQPNVLVLKDQGSCGCIKQDLAVAAARDGEAKGTLDVVEDELAVITRGCACGRARENEAGHLVGLLLGVFDENMETGVCASRRMVSQSSLGEGMRLGRVSN